VNPRLIAISGPAAGQTFLLRGERLTVGRQPESDVELASLEVSRRHCELRRAADGRYSVVDLESRHGVFVNQRPVRERRLEHSDLLTVGGSVLLFLLDDSSTTGAAAPIPADVPFVAASTVARKPSELVYLDPTRVGAGLPAQVRIARDLQTLLRTSAALQGPLALEALAERLLDAVLEVVPAARAAVLVHEPGAGELAPLAARNRDGGGGFAASPGALEPVLRDKVGVLASGTAGSLLASPLLDRDGEVAAVIYADSPAPEAFDERHLDLLGTVAVLGSAAFQNALHLRRIEGENRRLRDHQLHHDMIGESASMRRLFDLVARVARAASSSAVRLISSE